MTSGIVVLKYMPDICINCPLSDYSNQGRPFCEASRRHIDTFISKPDWCPLIKLPNKEPRSDMFDEYEDGWADGFNYLRSIILGEIKEEE